MKTKTTVHVALWEKPCLIITRETPYGKKVEAKRIGKAVATALVEAGMRYEG